MIEAGTLLQQRYRIDKQIGQGGMGAVYVATDERFGSTVAIKETLFMDSNFRKAIEREARLLNSLKHPALPRVTDHFEESNSQFLVMEYIAGEDLSAILEREEKPFEVETVLDWADQLLDALDFLHTQDMPVVHRDIKPQNLKLTPNGRIVLLDFGLAKGNPTDASHQTQAKSIFGYSRNYASLEQIQGTGTDPRSDIYSLAATLYHLVTGIPPEDALTRAMSVLSKRPDSLVPANFVRTDIPSGVAGVLQKSLDLDASGRPNSSAEMRQMFKEHEKYGYLIDAELNAHLSKDAPQLIQDTNTLHDQTAAAAARNPSEVKTEVMPDNLSQVTAIRLSSSTGGTLSDGANRSDSAGNRPSRRPLAFAAAGIVGFLLISGALAAGVYKFAPFSSNSSVQPDQSGQNGNASKPDAMSGTAAAPSDPNATASQSAGADGAPSTSERSRPVTAEERPPEPVRPTKPSSEERQRVQNEPPDPRMPPDRSSPNDAAITLRNPDGTMTPMDMPKDNARGRNPRNPNVRVTPGMRFPGGFDPNNLPPSVKRKMADALRKKGIPTIQFPN